MYRLFALGLFATTALSLPTAALADVIDFESGVKKVLVFPQGAQVTRLAEGSVPQGDHVITIDDLPGNVLPDSVRVRGVSSGSLVQSSVDVRQVTLGNEDQPAERKRLLAAIETLQFENQTLGRKMKDIALQRQLLQALATRALGGPADESGAAITGSSVDGLLESAAARLGKLQDEETAALSRQNAIGKEIAELQIQLNQLAPSGRVQTVVQINVAAEAANQAAFEIEYKVQQAGWRPVYDARLSMGDDASNASLELLRRASVYQNTGEAWQGVELSLSTARPSSATTAPTLTPYEIDQQPEPKPVPMVRQKSSGGLLSLNGSRVQEEAGQLADAVVAASQPEVGVEVAGFQAVFTIPGVTSVENTGETKSVTIDRFELDTDIYALAVPRFDATAYLMADFVHDGETPLLPGKVSLTRDGVFIGNGRLPLIAAGERHELGFGSDDQISIERVETDKEKGESGFVSTRNTDRRVFKTTVTNQHDFSIPIKIRDRMPVSNQEDITIEMTRGSTTPDQRNVDDKRGILEWSKEVGAGEAWEINFGYEVTWPDDMEISRID